MGVQLRKRKLKGGRFSYYLDIFHNGRRITETLGLITGKDAQTNKALRLKANDIRTQREKDLMLGNTDIMQIVNGEKDFLEYFKTIQIKRPKSKTYLSCYSNLVELFGDNITFKMIDLAFLNKYKAWLLSRVTINTAHQYLTILKAVLRSAAKDKMINHTLLDNFENLRKTDVIKDYLTLDELQRISNAKIPKRKFLDGEEIRRAFLFACYTGLRWSDVANLKWENINGDKLNILVIKTQRPLNFVLEGTALSLLLKKSNGVVTEMREPKDNVFNLPSYSSALTFIKELCKDAGITKHVSFHTTRHTFGTLAVKSGIPAEVLMELLGHRDLKTTQIYYQITEDTKRLEILKLPKLEV